MLREAGDIPSRQTDREFGEADYAAPTIDIAYTHMGTGSGLNSQEKQNPAVAVGGLSVSVPGSKQFARRGRRRQKPLFVVVPLLIMVVLFIMAGLIFLASPLAASASVTIGPQVHVHQQVYTITAQPSQTGIDVVTTSIPAPEKVETITGSLTVQTADQQCNRFFFIQCQQASDLTSQLRQSLISQLSARMDSQLLALHATEIGSKQFTDLSASSTPAIGSGSRTITVTLTEQGSVEYIKARMRSNWRACYWHGNWGQIRAL